MIRLGNRMFLWCKTKNGNKLVEMKDAKTDKLFGVERLVTSRIYSKELMSQDDYDKELVNVMVDLAEVDVSVGFRATTYFKAGQASQYTKMNTVDMVSSVCKLNALPNGMKQLNLGGQGNLANSCDRAFNASNSVFKKGQLLLEVTGDWILDSITARFQVKGMSGNPEFKCKYDIKELNIRDCTFVDDWNLLV